MIDFDQVKEMTQREMEEMRQRAIAVLRDNQEVYVAKWILDNPYERISDYRLKFYNDDPNCVYSVAMEKIENV